MIKNQTDKFDIPEHITYLNCAFMSPLMHNVMNGMELGATCKQHPWTVGFEDFVSAPNRFKHVSAQLIGASPDHMAIIPSASYGLQIAANNIPMVEGQEIIVLAEQFPSNYYPWLDKAQKCGGHIVTVERPKAEGWTNAVLNAIGPNTAILAIPATHWADGGFVDLVRVGQKAREVGAALVLDLTQSLGVMPFDVNAVKPDFMIAACYKWLMGPYTYGMMYVDEKWHGGEPLEHGWITKASCKDFTGLVNYCEDFQEGAVRYDMGEKSNAGQALAATAGIEQILEWGVDNIYQTLSTRNSRYAKKARSMGLEVDPCDQRSGHFLSIKFKHGIPDKLLADCIDQDIFISTRGCMVRVTPHLYNTDAHMDRLFGVLETCVASGDIACAS